MDDWKRLADHVISARVDAGYRSRGAFATASGVSKRTLDGLENGHPVSPATLAACEPCLGWKPGSCRKILDGGEPDLVTAPDLAALIAALPPELREHFAGLPAELRGHLAGFLAAAGEYVKRTTREDDGPSSRGGSAAS